MAKRRRIPKQIDRQLADLDHQLRILREQLHSLSEGDWNPLKEAWEGKI